MQAALAPSVSEERKWLVYRAPAILLGVALLLSFIVRIRLANAPLERDEGEHLYLAQMMLEGNAPWKLAYNLKLPGTDAVCAVFLALFGQTVAALRIGLLILNTVTVSLVALLGRRLFGISAGLVAGASYALLSASQNVVGTVFHSTHLVALFSVISTLLLLRSGLKPGKLLVTGLAFGLTFLMKQPGAAFAAFGALYVIVLWRQTRASVSAGVTALLSFGLGFALPYALLCLALWRAGVLDRFWFWTVTLAEAFATQRTFETALTILKDALAQVILPNLFLWLAAFIGLGLAISLRGTRASGLFTSGLMIFSFGAVSAGANFNPNYFVMMFPALALGLGALIASGESFVELAASLPDTGSERAKPSGKTRNKRKSPDRERGEPDSAGRTLFAWRYRRRLPFVFCVIACLFSVLAQGYYLLAMTPYEFSRSSYGSNPFPEAVQVGEYIRTHSDAGARVAVLGSEAEIYFYSHRRASTGYLFTYSLMETHQYAAGLQGDMIAEIEAAQPEYIVYVTCAASWLKRVDSPETLFDWISQYVPAHYHAVGIADIPTSGKAKYIWGPEAASYRITSDNVIVIWRRKH